MNRQYEIAEKPPKHLPFPTHLRPYQVDLIEQVEKREIKRFYCLWCARGGKDMTCLYILILRALNTPGGVFGYFLPTKEDARRIVVEGRLEDGRKLTSVLPKECVKEFNKVTLRIVFKNEAKIQFLPSERGHGNAGVGESWSGAIFSEFSLMKHARELLNIVVPRVNKKNDSFIIINTTPRGAVTTAFQEWEKHFNNPETCYASKVVISDIFEQPYIDWYIKAYTMDSLEVQRELYCDFHAPVKNAIYADLLQNITLKKIDNIPEECRIFIGMDLGFKRDATAWWAFYKDESGYNFIDFDIIFSGNLFDIVRSILSEYESPFFFLPHDGDRGGGSGVADRFREMKLPYQIVPKAFSVEEEIKGIIRPFLTNEKVFFRDNSATDTGLSYLKMYRRTDNGLIYHGNDGASDVADAFRYCIVGAYRFLQTIPLPS